MASPTDPPTAPSTASRRPHRTLHRALRRTRHRRTLQALCGLLALLGATLPGAAPPAQAAPVHAAPAHAAPAHAAPARVASVEPHRAAPVAAAPDRAQAARLFAAPEAGVKIRALDAPVAGWAVSAEGQDLGLIGSTWTLAASTGYSGQPIDVLVAVRPDGVIAGAELVRHNEPILTLGISDADIAAFVGSFAGYDMTADHGADTLSASPGLPDIISRATVSSGVIRDGILRTARALALAQGSDDGGIERTAYAPADWAELVAMGALSHATTTMAEAAAALPDARVPVTPSDKPWLDLWAGIIDPPTVGRNLLGQRKFNEAAGALGPGEVLLLVASNGLQGHRGTDWKQSGRFERLAVTQGEVHVTPLADGALTVAGLAAEGAPAFREITVLRLPADPETGGLDIAEPFTLDVTTSRPAADGRTLTLDTATEVALPQRFIIAPGPDGPPLWLEFWRDKRPQIVVVGIMLAILGLILFAQEWLIRRVRFYRGLRLGYLAVTLLVLGWGLNVQLSVVQVVAFLHSLLSGFRWETFLIAPLIFIMWSAVALGMLFWGRGVFCGWLCPFGALQELANAAAQRLGIRQIAVPQALHERLWVIKYSLFVAIVALSFYSMEQALILAEVEPFKTAISMRFLRPWPFVLFVAAILGASLFIERFYCRYMCPLGAGLALPAKLKIFDWLKRRPQCGRECRLCEFKCPVGAIDRLGRINANECVLCLRCQVMMEDPQVCPVLKRRARGVPTGGLHPASLHAAGQAAPHTQGS